MIGAKMGDLMLGLQGFFCVTGDHKDTVGVFVVAEELIEMEDWVG